MSKLQLNIIVKHHYHFNVFNEAIEYILMELNTRFNELSVELFSLSVALDPKNSFESFNMMIFANLQRNSILKILQIKTLLLWSMS